MRNFRRISFSLWLLVVVATSFVGAMWYKDGPPVAHTGGFGEPTCHRCHADGPVEDPAVTLLISGVPDRYRAGEAYELSISVDHPKMKVAGFQLSSRYFGTELEGQQGGALIPAEGNVRVDEDSTAIQYLSHAQASSDGRRGWRFLWRAPVVPAPVVFHAAANASNNDDSEFGDHTASTVVMSYPVAPPDADPQR